MGTPLPLPNRWAEHPQIFGPCLLRPNGWMNEAGTWHGDRPQPRRLCVRSGPSPLPPKRGGAPCPIFGPFLLWPNGSMHQDATWYGCWPQPRGLCVRWRPSLPSPTKGAEPPSQFSAHCAQMAGCIKMPLCTEVGLSPGALVLDGDPAPLPKRGQSPLPNFKG